VLTVLAVLLPPGTGRHRWRAWRLPSRPGRCYGSTRSRTGWGLPASCGRPWPSSRPCCWCRCWIAPPGGRRGQPHVAEPTLASPPGGPPENHRQGARPH
jgi:hypothetical protein